MEIRCQAFELLGVRVTRRSSYQKFVFIIFINNLNSPPFMYTRSEKARTSGMEDTRISTMWIKTILATHEYLLHLVLVQSRQSTGQRRSFCFYVCTYLACPTCKKNIKIWLSILPSFNKKEWNRRFFNLLAYKNSIS